VVPDILAIVCALLAGLASFSSSAASPKEIVELNTRSTIFIQVEDDQGSVLNSGSGFIVSQDGFVVTAAHIKADPTQQVWAVVGQREGIRYRLSLREADEATDTAIWQLPQSTVCRQPATLSNTPVKVFDRAVALGFPGKEGLTPASFTITNLRTALGFYKADGLLQPGQSGGPVFNEEGHVIAFVEGGMVPGAQANDLVPIAPAVSLLRKYNVKFGLNAPVEFESSCYAKCRNSSHGVERWSSEKEWGPVNTGWLGGGNNPRTQCALLVAATQATIPGSNVELLAGEGDSSKGMWEKSKKDALGHVEYKYYCRGRLKMGAIYKEMQSPACGLWN
jgi:hypothetical protein